MMIFKIRWAFLIFALYYSSRKIETVDSSIVLLYFQGYLKRSLINFWLFWIKTKKKFFLTEIFVFFFIKMMMINLSATEASHDHEMVLGIQSRSVQVQIGRALSSFVLVDNELIEFFAKWFSLQELVHII